MSRLDLLALLPYIVLAGVIVLVTLTIAFRRSHRLIVAITMIGLIAVFAMLFIAVPHAPRQVTPLFIIDYYSLYYTGLLVIAGLFVALLSYGYWERHHGPHEEFYSLLLLAILGSTALVASSHFASFFLGLEILSVSLYALIAYQRDNLYGLEAGIKYLILAGVSSAFILFGMALVYNDLGTMSLAAITLMGVGGAVRGALAYTGFGLILVGIGFKLGLVPFHLWTPDVYEGSPAPVTALIASVSKGAVFALLLRYFTPLLVNPSRHLLLLFTLLAIASMFVGNLLALQQRNVKRILAYSSIAHMGYLLVAFLAGGVLGTTAVTFYLTAYFVTIIGAFGVGALLSVPEREAGPIDDYRGLAWRHPWLAGVLTVSLLSLAGIPLTAGFIGKFLVFTSGVGSSLWLLVITLVLNSGLGLYYYLRVVVSVYRLPAEEQPGVAPADRIRMRPSFSFLGGLALAVLALLLIWLGVYPSPMIHIIQHAVSALLGSL